MNANGRFRHVRGRGGSMKRIFIVAITAAALAAAAVPAVEPSRCPRDLRGLVRRSRRDRAAWSLGCG